MAKTDVRLNFKMDSNEPPVIFFLPGSGEGEAKYWEPFASVVQLIPVFYPDWTELIKPEANFTSFVSHLKSQIQTHARPGQWILAGYSLGGAMAYVCAAALQLEGLAPEHLIILDSLTYAPRHGTNWRKRLEKMLTFRVRAGMASTIAKLLTRTRGLPFLEKFARLRHVELPFNFSAYLHPQIKMYLLQRLFGPWWHDFVQQNKALRIPTVLYRSNEHESWEPDDLGWRQYCPNLTVKNVSASHEDMLNELNLSSICIELAEIARNPSTTATQTRMAV
jgi:thioesterase domain-containing protein